MAKNSKNREFAAVEAGLPIGRETTLAQRRRNRKIHKDAGSKTNKSEGIF